jgi:D-inositol-3-phosphate glycosyltransferase
VGPWADAIGGLLADPVRRQALGQAGLARAERFGRPANAAALAEVYRSALS